MLLIGDSSCNWVRNSWRRWNHW